MSFRDKFDLTINVPNGKWLSQVPGLEQIPSNCILYKTRTGIGATFSEVISKRHSIIMLPNVSIIKNKHGKYQSLHETFAVYGDSDQTKLDDIMWYMLSDIPYKKFLTTPQGLKKIKYAIEILSRTSSTLNLFSDFFLLVDECHKLVKDVGYREDMVPPMDDFFQFSSKALVSATVLEFSDPRFVEQEFKYIKIRPVHSQISSWFRNEPMPRQIIDRKNFKSIHPFKKEIRLYNVNSLTNGLVDYVNANPAPANCIFLNSIDGIKSIIKSLGIEHESKIYCSTESALLLKKNGIECSVSNAFLAKDGKSLLKYNFFTSSFFTGLDIDLCIKPNIIILTDCYALKFSVIDPFTDTAQIIGRFRNNMYQSVVHINVRTSYIEQRTETELANDLRDSKVVYEAMGAMSTIAENDNIRKMYEQHQERSFPYAKLISDGKYSYFKADNIWDRHRVRSYYREHSFLSAAYRKSGLFDIVVDGETYDRTQIIKLSRSAGKYNVKMVRQYAEVFDELELIFGTFYYHRCREHFEKLFPLLVEPFKHLGHQGFKDLNFSIRAIKQKLILIHREQGFNYHSLIDLVLLKFKVGNRYSREFIKTELQAMYNLLDFKCTAKATDLGRFFVMQPMNLGNRKGSLSGFELIEQRYSSLKVYDRP